MTYLQAWCKFSSLVLTIIYESLIDSVLSNVTFTCTLQLVYIFFVKVCSCVLSPGATLLVIISMTSTMSLLHFKMTLLFITTTLPFLQASEDQLTQIKEENKYISKEIDVNLSILTCTYFVFHIIIWINMLHYVNPHLWKWGPTQ